MFGHVRLKPDTMVACNRQIGSLLNVMYPPPYGRQCVIAWWSTLRYRVTPHKPGHINGQCRRAREWPAHVEHPTNGRWTGARPGFWFDSGCTALYLVLSPKDISRYGLGTWLMAECLFYSFLVFEQLEHMFYTDYTK